MLFNYHATCVHVMDSKSIYLRDMCTPTAIVSVHMMNFKSTYLRDVCTPTAAVSVHLSSKSTYLINMCS